MCAIQQGVGWRSRRTSSLEFSARTQPWIFSVRFSGSDVSPQAKCTTRSHLAPGLAGRNDQTVWPLKDLNGVLAVIGAACEECDGSEMRGKAFNWTARASFFMFQDRSWEEVGHVLGLLRNLERVQWSYALDLIITWNKLVYIFSPSIFLRDQKF